jgi:hypothetical protein
MMTFSEYVASQEGAGILPARQRPPIAVACLASPGLQDTKRAIERARRRGTPVTPADLKASISPESLRTAKQGVLDLSAAPSPQSRS